MRTIEAISRSGIGIDPKKTIRDAAKIMEHTAIGSLAVVSGHELVGIVTDRDLVRRVLAENLSADSPIEEVMSSPVIHIDADADIREAFAIFGSHGVRRLAVCRGSEFRGMLSIDDLLVELSSELVDLVRPIERAIERAETSRRVAA